MLATLNLLSKNIVVSFPRPDAVVVADTRGMDHLFVYGTLLSGVATPAMAALMARLQFLGSAGLPGTLYDLGPYPAAVPETRGGDHARFGRPTSGDHARCVRRLPCGPHGLLGMAYTACMITAW